MATLKEEAMMYESRQVKNIAELDKIPVNLVVSESTANDSKGLEFSYKHFEHEGETYRVPNSVLKQLRVHLEETQDLKLFKVVKKGTGLDTEYTVIPIIS